MKIIFCISILITSFFCCSIHAKNLQQKTEHDYTTARYYLGLDDNRSIDKKLNIARLKGDQVEQVRILCIDVRKHYESVIALNKANRHFNPKKIDADTKSYQSLLNDLKAPQGCPKATKEAGIKYP